MRAVFVSNYTHFLNNSLQLIIGHYELGNSDQLRRAVRRLTCFTEGMYFNMLDPSSVDFQPTLSDHDRDLLENFFNDYLLEKDEKAFVDRWKGEFSTYVILLNDNLRAGGRGFGVAYSLLKRVAENAISDAKATQERYEQQARRESQHSGSSATSSRRLTNSYHNQESRPHTHASTRASVRNSEQQGPDRQRNKRGCSLM